MAEPNGDTSNPVSWQSAFWGIAIIAFNTATQDSGEVLKFPAKYRMALRSSPCFCLVDIIDVLVRLGLGCRKHSLRKTLRRLAVSRVIEESDSDEKTMVSWLFRWIIVVLSITQLVKVFSFKGLPWTAAFAAIYMTASFAQGVLNWSSRNDHIVDPEDPPPPKPVVVAPEPLEESSQSHEFATVDLAASSSAQDPALQEESISIEDFRWAYRGVRSFVTRSAPLIWRRVCPLFCQFIMWAWLAGSDQDPDIVEHSFVRFGVIGVACMISFFCFLMTVPLLSMILVLVCIDLIVAILPSIFILVGLGLALRRHLEYIRDRLAEIFALSQGTIDALAMWLGTILLSYVQVVYLGWFHITKATGEIFAMPLSGLVDRVDKLFSISYRLSSGFWILAAASAASYLVFRVLCKGIISRKMAILQSWDADTASWGALHMLLLNIMTGLLYYWKSYAEDGTYKPAWAENLG